jgi:hypothetical protein
MKIIYTFSPETLRKGASEFLWHRQRIVTLLFPFLGVPFMLFGLNYIFGSADPNYILGGIMCAVGAFYLIRFKFRTNGMVKNAFKSNPNTRPVTLIIEDGTLFISDGESEGKCPLSSLVDFKICKTGLLIYPQKNIFYWIPENAEIQGGTWQDFITLISSGVTRKI